MTKTAIRAEVKQLWNNTRVIYGIPCAKVAWMPRPYYIIRDEESFDQVSTRGYEPLKDFYYQSELIDYIDQTLKLANPGN